MWFIIMALASVATAILTYGKTEIDSLVGEVTIMSDKPKQNSPKAETGGDEYSKRVTQWLETIDSFLALLQDMDCWYHFCLLGFFYVPVTGKYVEVAIYQNDNKEFTYRCISYTKATVDDIQMYQASLGLNDLIEQLLYRHDPEDFSSTYTPVKWEIIEESEIVGSCDMKRIDEMYKLSGKQEQEG